MHKCMQQKHIPADPFHPLPRAHQDKADEKEGRQVSFTDSLPWVPPWDPILEEKPEWARQAVRALAGVWTILGVMLWSCLRPRPAPSDKDAGSVSPRSMAKKLE